MRTVNPTQDQWNKFYTTWDSANRNWCETTLNLIHIKISTPFICIHGQYLPETLILALILQL